jgi:hypothetical protein
MLPMSCRKRLLSEQNDYRTSIMKYSNDRVGRNKKIKTGNFVT